MQRESLYKRFVPARPDEKEPSDSGYCLAFSSSRLLVKSFTGHFEIPRLSDLDRLGLTPLRKQYLGKWAEHPCFSAELTDNPEIRDGFSLVDLRTFYFDVEEDLYLLAGRALQIVAWEQTHQFCGRCGHPTTTLAGETAKVCPVCHFTSYPRIAPAVIVGVTDSDRILLTRYATLRAKWFTIIAGFLEPGETLEECVRREIQEEVGLQVKNIRYFGNQPWPFPNSLMIGFTAEYAGGEIKVDGKEIAEAHWFTVDNIPEVPPRMSISREIIDWFVDSHRRGGKVTGL